MLVTPLVGLILASLQLSMIFYAGQLLQTAAVSGASRELMTGAAAAPEKPTCNTRRTSARNRPCRSSSTAQTSWSTCSRRSSYSSLNTTPITLTYNGSGAVTNNFAYSTGNPGDILIVRIMYSWPVIASPLMPGLANQPNGNHLLVATSVFKTEPLLMRWPRSSESGVSCVATSAASPRSSSP